MFNRKFSSNIRRKKRMITSIIILLVVFLSIGYSAFSSKLSIDGELNISKYDQTLYGVLKKAAKKGTYAKEYTGDHQDSMAGVGTEKIYYWYGSNDTNGTAILDMNNVIFANHCWQMIRTTDTGGVKMIYNGEPEDGKCLNTRGNHVGYASRTTQSMSTTYYYGTSYTYDSTNNVFSLDGTVTTGTINTGEYTCKQTTSTGTCATLYLVDTLSSGTTYYVLPLNGNSNYSQFGTLQFNQSYDSPSYVGYMYNTVYPYKSSNGSNWGALIQNATPITESDYNVTSNDETYPFTFDSTTNMWTSTMKQDSTSASIKFNVTTNNDYVISYTISSEANYDKAYFYKNGTELKNDSGSKTGSISLTGLTTTDEIEVKYSKDSSSSSGTDSVSFSIGTPTGDPIDNRYQFGNSVEYTNGTYKLKDTIKAEISDNLNNNHYTCFTTGDTCSKVNYIYYISSTTAYYIELENGKSVEDAVDEMLYNDNVNATNSTIKIGIDAWYKRYMTDYSDKLEDTIFCNDRSISNLGGWNPDGGSVSTSLQFKNYSSNSDLSCTNVTDKFSTANTKAQLTYPVGLLTYPETYLLNNNNIRKTGQSYWLGSPYYFNNGNAYERYVLTSGSYSSRSVYNSHGVRPAVSLTPGTEYTSGDGSMANPYVVDMGLQKPRFSESGINDGVKTITITYSAKCGTDYTCKYTKNDDSEITVTTETVEVPFDGSGVITATISDGTDTLSKNHNVRFNKLYVKSDGSDTTGFGTITKPYETIEKAYEMTENTATIYVMDNITDSTTATFNKEKSITLTSCTKSGSTCTTDSVNSVTRESSFNGNLINSKKGTLTLETIKLAGNRTSTASIINNNKATLNLNTDATLSDSYGEYGGAIYNTSGVININGSTISNNTASKNGGGIYLKGGSLTMNSGTISSNISNSGGGGGIFLTNNGDEVATMTLNGGTIKDNANIGNMGGGGIALFNDENNTQQTTLNIAGGTITGNHAGSSDGDGGGVYAFLNTNINMTSGTISSNTAGLSGGGVMTRGIFTMSGGKINSNTVQNSKANVRGGGVQVSSDATFTITGGNINNNVVIMNSSSANYAASGGGIGVFNGGKVIISQASGKTTTVSGNQVNNNNANASCLGGGLWCNSPNCSMTGGTMANNTTEGRGGGVYITSTRKFTLSGGTIKGNSAGIKGGGIYKTADGTYTKSGSPSCTNNGQSGLSSACVWTAN